MNKLFYIKTFGCQMNERDSEIMGQLLAQSGYRSTSDMELANLILINTCSIREKAEQKVYSLLGQLRDLKEKNPDLRVGVTGCVAQQEGARIVERMPHVDLVVGTQQMHLLPSLLKQLETGVERRNIALSLDKNFQIPPFQRLLHTPDLEEIANKPALFKSFVTIMQGCNNYCSYCVVPYTRGPEISRPVADILEEVSLLLMQGVREIILLGQNVNSYGKTNSVAKHLTDFPGLLRKVAQLSGIKRLRFTTSHPKDLSDELMQCFAEIEVLCPHFHLPVQSGSDRVLAKMNRKYTIAQYKEKVKRLLSLRPGIAMATDFIVGFPGETEEDFQNTLNLLQEIGFHSSFSFKYSDRPQARSTELEDKVAEPVKSERLARLQKLQGELTLKHNSSFLGKHVEVMIEECDGTQGKGRSGANQVVHFFNETEQPILLNFTPGDLVDVLIEHAGPHSLRGKIVQKTPK